MSDTVTQLPPSPPWSAEIGAMAGLLGWLEDVLTAYSGEYGEAKARELLEAGLLEAENRRRGPLLTARYIAELRPQ
jgi:hypothetical protein